jgi:hypothetical protein
MSADTLPSDALLKTALIWSLLACGAVAADEEPAPDLEFLEYLGSWEESDEDWVLLAAEVVAQTAAEETDKENVPVTDGEKLAEMADEN